MGPLRTYAPTALYCRKKESQFLSAYYSKPTTKGQEISKANFKVSFEPKNKRKYFCIFVLASENP